MGRPETDEEATQPGAGIAVNRRVLGAAWYRFRATLPRRRGGYLTVALLVGLLGGVAMGAVAGARRTQSAFPAYLAATDNSDLQVQTYLVTNQIGSGPTLTTSLAHLPFVEHVASAPNLLITPLGPNGKAQAQAVNDNEVTAVGSVGGMYFHQDRVTVAQGRMADPHRTDEMVASAEAAKLSHWHVGDTVRFGAFTVQQASSPGWNPATTTPARQFSEKLVGIVVFPSEVVNDDVDRFPTDVLMTPALTSRIAASDAYPYYGLKLEHGTRDVAEVERDIINLLPPGTVYTFHVTSVVEGQVERASKPEAIALGVFGAIAALAALIIAGLAISRSLWANGEDLDVLRALGADPTARTVDAILGLLSAVILGALLAVGVAAALSPLAPIGPARQVDPSPGFAVDWTVLGTGFGVLVAGLGLLTVVLARLRATRRHDEGAEERDRGSAVVNLAGMAGLPVSAVAGLRFSLERGRGRTAVPVRSALVGAVVAVVVVVSTLTFGSGLATLDSHPALYGWNWTYAISSPSGGNLPVSAGRLLDHDPDVAAWTGFDYANAQLDGQTVPILLTTVGAKLAPPILSGHGLRADNEVVLGAATMASLHEHVGGTISVSYGSPRDAPIYLPPTTLKIVGTATMPAIGVSGALHPSMGTGALIPKGIGPASFRRALASPDPNLNGPTIAVVRDRSGVTPATALSSLQRIAVTAAQVVNADPNSGGGESYVVLSVQRPAEIVNYQATGATPVILATGLAAGAVVALGLTLIASVRRRRRDLALLKTLGFHPGPVGCHRRLAGDGGSGRRGRGGRARRDRTGPVAVGPLRPRHLRRLRAHRSGRGRRGGGRGRSRARQPGGRRPGTDRGPDGDGSRAPGRMRTGRHPRTEDAFE